MRPVLPEHDRADRVLLQVQRQAEAAAREFQHFAVLRVGEAVDAHDAVGHRHDRADVALLGGARELLDARLDQIADFGGFDCHYRYLGVGLKPDLQFFNA
jgi:hypothetical protein